MGDVTGNGRPDLYFAQLNGPNRLYENRGGFEFRNITDSAGVAHEGYYSTSTVFADIDGDDDLDLLVGSMSKGIAIYENEGRGRFRGRSGTEMEVGKGNMTMALADIEGDGDLDLYVANYKEKSVRDIYPVGELSWEKTIRSTEGDEGTNHVVVPPYDEHYTIIERDNAPNSRRETGEKDALYLNNGNGEFKKVQRPEARFLGPDGSPRGLSLDWGLNASFRDINCDGPPDLYVNNDFWTPDRVWINQGDGTFRAIDSLAIRSFPFSSMTVDFSDVTRNGALDFFVTEMLSPEHQRRLRQFTPSDPFPAGRMENRPQYNKNALYRNRGDGTYAESAYFSGVEATGWSWGVRFLDVTLNGYEDLLVNTGFSYDYQDLDSQERMGRKMAQTPGDDRFLTEYPRLRLENRAFQNNKDGTFSTRGQDWGFVTESDVSHGLVTADLDRDGDLDVVVSRLNDRALLYENTTSAPRISVRLAGTPPNTQAIGAKLALKGGPGGPAPQVREVTAGGNYLSGSSTTAMFAADPDNSNHVLEVTWPNGDTTIIDSVGANRVYEVQQGRSRAGTEPEEEAHRDSSSSAPSPAFQEVSGRLDHRHHESTYDDFRIQPLLPLKLSQQGPGLSWVDYDQDGDEDVMIPTGRGGTLAVYENDGAGNFSRRTLGTLTDTSSADQTTLLGWSTDSGTHLLLGRANYEPGDIQTPSALHFLAEGDTVRKVGRIPGILSTTGPLAAADYDGDGAIDLFVGGRFMPAQYPRDATSRLFRNEEGRFVCDEENAALLEDFGLVTGAVFTDYDRDGDPDLLISRAWDSLMLLENEGGTFRDVTAEFGLDAYSGWWQGVTTGDFNNDGRPDIVATNWGTNSPYQTGDRPLKMYYQDFNGDRRVEIIESYYDADIGGYVPRRQLNAFSSTAVPFAGRVDSHTHFASATLTSLLGQAPDQVLNAKTLNTTKHMVFLNEGDHFSARPLPSEAQLSTALHAGVADYNNDGHEDLFLSQNFFPVRDEMPRSDAGRGLLLRGNGHGDFEAIPGHRSGIKVYGEQRGAAFGDFDKDGRVDLAVTQNGAPTKLFANQADTEGYTVRLNGPPRNRDGIGASVRLRYEDGSAGPRREVRAGGGYWSQSSRTQVLGAAKPVSQIEVTWPDGQVNTRRVAEDKRRYRVSYTDEQ
ncbi:MAG: FG-GAP-like repeat-containing protein [Candidatus Bipolaricaulia bacterium]